ncbi:hypothetical protein DPEC_G00082990 [Dallia pectoralis]|uniref:Uncharacterized protein n=1 Tax=Dallia pectoralis TaxID=75939 RepID=A0ACC2GYW6_DALPE|nr:hypothetical protein DPEC_G00082990 [Dallia pectoralis]
MNPVNYGDGRDDYSTQLFAAGTERTLAGNSAIVYGRMPLYDPAPPPTPPSPRLTNPFLMPGESRNETDEQNPFSPAHAWLSQFTSTPFTTCMPRPEERSGVISYAHDDNYASHRDRYQYGRSAAGRAKSAPRFSHAEPDVEIMDTSDNEYYGHKERIPILKPGHFDGTGSWKDFIHRFESCARANHWSEMTMAVQLRFSLTGAAGAIVHKNPRSDRWSYRRIVTEIETAYGPRSDHAAATCIELRQRIRGQNEALHLLRDDIYEKVSIVYADRTELEQDAISVEVFTNALADPDVVQKLLEKQPRTLSRAYDIAHSHETTKRAARTVTQFMQPGQRGFVNQRARAATVHESNSRLACVEPVGVAVWSIDSPERAPRLNQQWRQKRDTNVKRPMGDVQCHNCSGLGHIQRNCPSPRRPRQQGWTVSKNTAPDPGKVVTCTVSQEDDMCVKILMYELEMRALLDSGARRNVLPLHVFNSFPTESRTPIEPSAAQVLQGIGPSGLAVLGEVNLPVQVGSRATNVNFIIADTTENTEVILGHPFLHQTSAQLDYGRREITLFGEKVPRFEPSHQSRVHIVRVARTTVLESGWEYVVPGTAHLRHVTEGDLMLSPTKGFVEKHHVLVARVVVQAQRSTNVPIRIFNPGALPVTLKRGVVAGILQPATVLKKMDPEPFLAPPGFEPTDSACASLPSHLQVLYNDSCGGLSGGDQESLARLLRSYSDVFSSGPTDLGRTGLVQHDILTTPGPTVKQQPRRMARDKQTAADQQVQQSLETGVARPSNSSWAAPIIMVKKKDETLRLCVDYRPLNERTIKDAYPLPRIQDTLDTLSTARYFSTLDLTSGYWQVEMTPRARKAAAFCTRKGLFEWNVMPFGLCNAPATFQRLMDRVLAGLQWETCLVYLDDIIVLGRDGTEMLERLSQVFGRLRVANLKLKPSKCVLFREQVVYLGHIVSAKGVATDPKKIQKVAGWPAPRSVSEVRGFIGLASYYRRFVKDFASVAKPLHELTKKYARFNWTDECQEAFEQLKSRLTSAPVLGYPLDSGQLLLDTDASDWGIGAVLSQVQEGEERVLAYGSRRLSATEQNYCTTRRELLAAVEFTSHFRQYLLGRSFIIRTDHSSLRWLTRMREPEG